MTMNTSLKARLEEQENCKIAFREANYNGVALATVGFGKGKVMLDLAKEIIDKYKIKSILYVCDNRRLRDSTTEGFPHEIEKWATPEIKKIIKCECYQTAYAWVDQKYDLILADEVDYAMTPEYKKVFTNNNFRFKILVTGTLSPTKKKLLESIAPIVYKFTTTDAERRGIVNKTQYFLYNYRMTEFESKQYLKWTRAIGKAIAAEKLPQQINFLLGKRKEVLYNLESSYVAVRKVMGWLWKRNKQTRLVVFCERTAQADRVCKYSYHGGNEKDDNLTKFQNGEISGLSVVGKIKRGINLKNADTAIFEMLTGTSSTEFEQRNGRMKRLKTSEIATVIFMVPWYSYKDSEGETIWKPTIVDQWIYKCTCNLSNIEFINLKL
jgi:superfamily II DNA or RNA helicase